MALATAASVEALDFNRRDIRLFRTDRGPVRAITEAADADSDPQNAGHRQGDPRTDEFVPVEMRE
jgi:hypothetical protein